MGKSNPTELLKEVLKPYRLSEDAKTSLKKLINTKIKQDGLHIILKKIGDDYIAEIQGTQHESSKENIGVASYSMTEALKELTDVICAIRYL